jgi:hypothetical protein
MEKKYTYRFLPLILIICFYFVNLMYSEKVEKSERIISYGQKANVEIERYSYSGVQYITYRFKTRTEERISGTLKCGSECNAYLNNYIVSNPQKPSEFMFSKDIKEFNKTW